MSDFKQILSDLNGAGVRYVLALERLAGRERDLVDLRDLEIAHGELPDSRSLDRPHREEKIRSTWSRHGTTLRLSMFALVLGLAAAVLYEHAQAHCLQTSISAYWYTPARGYFVGMLIGMSVCMVCLRGSSEAENILLNFAGMFAPVVALVPTTPEKQMPCMQIQSALQERPASIANNGTALFAVGGVAIVLVLIISHREGMTRAAAGAAIGAFALWLAALLVFVFAREAFDDAAHLTAASAMFLCIIAVACIDAWETEPHRRLVNYRNAISRSRSAWSRPWRRRPSSYSPAAGRT